MGDDLKSKSFNNIMTDFHTVCFEFEQKYIIELIIINIITIVVIVILKVSRCLQFEYFLPVYSIQ